LETKHLSIIGVELEIVCVKEYKTLFKREKAVSEVIMVED